MPRKRLPSEDPSDSYDEGEDEGEGEGVDELSADEIPGEIESANCRVMSTRELFQQMTNHSIDVEPPYQRDVVWAKAAQSSLIDSIFKNKWVPTLLFSERVVSTETMDKEGRSKAHSSKKKRVWVCMDGKQRLTSIKLFLTGKIPWIRQPGKQWYFKQSNPPSPSRLIISEELQEIFLRRGITTALYQKLTEVQERDIFRLVQEGKPLTIGEKMQAAAGPWGEYFEELTQTYMVRDSKHPNGWCGRIAKMSRGADFKTMTSMVLLIRDMLRAPDTAPGLLTSAQLQKELIILQDVPVPQKLQKEVTMLLDMFMNISLLAPPNTAYTSELNTPEAIFAPIKQGRKSMISPVEMIWIPYLISRHGRQLSIGRLLELIELFKVDIRIKYPSEVKNNKEVTRFIVNWITTVDLRRLKGKYSGFRVPQRPDLNRGNPTSFPAATQAQSSMNRAERQDTKVNGINPPGSAPQSKRKVNPLNDSDTASTATSKRPRQSVPHPLSNLAPSATTTPQSRLDQASTPSSASVITNASGPSVATRLAANGTGSNQVNGNDRANGEAIGPSFANNTQSRPEINRVGQLSSFGAASNQQFGQPPNLAARAGSMGPYGGSQQTHAARNLDNARPRSSYAAGRPF